MYDIGQRVFDLFGSLGFGEIIDIYTNYHDDPGGVKMYIVDFGDDQVTDRLESEIED